VLRTPVRLTAGVEAVKKPLRARFSSSPQRVRALSMHRKH
jgi:hypothetical protein